MNGTTGIQSGRGGNTSLGGGGQERVTNATGNSAPANTGSGGGGGAAIGAVSAVTGGAGGTGLIVVWEFS